MELRGGRKGGSVPSNPCRRGARRGDGGGRIDSAAMYGLVGRVVVCAGVGRGDVEL